MKCPNCNKEVKVAWIYEEYGDADEDNHWRHIDLKQKGENIEAGPDYLEKCRFCMIGMNTFNFCYECDTAITIGNRLD